MSIAKKDRKYKAVAFDLNGTILQGANFQQSWKTIWASLGYDDRIRKGLYDKHHQDPKLYTFYQWTADCVQYFKAKKLHQSHIDQIIEECKITPASDVLLTLQELKKHNIFTAIISGGINCFFNTVGSDIKSLINKTYINTFHFDDAGYLIDFTPYNIAISEFQAKSKALDDFCALSNCNIKDSVYVSDGNEDSEILQYCGLGIVVGGVSKLTSPIPDVLVTDKISEIITHIING